MPTHQHLVDKMRRHSCFVFLFCGIFLPGILGFPQTNTSIDCDSLLPNYEAEPQTSAPPYIIAVSFDNFEPGNEVQVTLEALGDAGFKGFNLQAREIDGDVPVGTFKITDPNTKGLECHNMTNSAVSHANSDVKQKVTTTWIAPQDARELQFIATVVQNLENFWVGIQSKTLTPIHSVSVNATGKSKRKLMIELECNKRGGTYSTGRCIMVGPSSSSQNSYSGSQGGVVYTISKSGCVPGGAAGAYGQQACRDSASLSSSGLTYGQSVPSSSSDSSKKVVVVANSNPFPPVRHTFPQSLGSSATRIIVQSGQKQQTSSSTYVQGSQGSQSYSQGYRPQSGSSYSQGYRPQSGSSYSQGGPGFSGSSSSYGQGSQGSQSYGQGYQPQGGSSYGQQGGSASYGGSSGCGQGVSYDSNPCHQGGSQGGQGGSYSSQNYGGSQQSGSSYSQSYSDNQDGSYSQNYGGGQGGSSSDTYYENQDSQDFSDDSNPNACDDNDTTYSANNQRSGCAKKKVLVARDTSHVLSRRAYDAQNASSPSNSSQSDIQGGSFIATSGSSNQGGCICPDGSSGHRQGAPGSSYSTYSGNQGGPFFYPGGSYGQGGPGSSHSSYYGNQGGPSFYPGGSYGQGAPGSSYSTYSGNQGGPFFYPGGSYGQGGPGSSHSSYYGNQGGPSFYPGGSYGQGGSSAYDGSSESYGQGGSSTYSGSDAYGQDSLSMGGSETEDSDSALPTGDGQSERDFYSPGGSQSGGHGSSSQSGSYASGQDSSSSGSSQYGGQGSSSSGGSQSGGQGGCDCSGGSSGGSPSLVRSDSSANDSSSSGGSQYNSQEPSSYGGSQYGGQGSPSSGGSQYGGQGSPSSGGSQYGGQDPSLPGGSHYGGQGIASSGSSQYSGQGFSSGVRQSGGQGGCVCPGGGSGSFTGTNYHGGQGSYSGSNQYGGQGSYPSGSSQYGGQGGRPSGGRPHGKPGSSSSGGSHQGKPGGSGSGSTYSGKPQSPYSGGSQVSSAGKHSTPQLLMLFSVLSAFALSAAVSKWSI
ncbi:hornerin-like isoform X50 [Corvus cornix cornix]|uniref:hornerin-like isoform X50 n=1 Tax=Corvus cornix cornix TaxID=932674 RepID=UPI001951C735|nr:hornerin-like isoform X50 [Corvus cornix cornix]